MEVDRTKRRRAVVALALVVLTVAACASQPYVDRAGQPGFLSGLLHGFIAWAALIAHLFDRGMRIYAFPNAGGWYDFGFLIGVSVWGGGGGAAARR